LNEKLLKLKQKKLTSKVSYLRSELEETTLIFQDCLVNFQKEFGSYLEDYSSDKDNPIKTELEFDIPDRQVNILFRRIAGKTHPDKLIHKDISEKEFNKRVTLYKRANNAVKQKDWAKLKDIATSLDIDLTYDEIDDILYLEETTKSLAEKVKELMSTYAWAWAHVQEQNRELLRKQILKTFKNE
tara:strand:+ start:592 stop:1146 length:555 start_codon:yes stop_codon:yes gene_type:complete